MSIKLIEKLKSSKKRRDLFVASQIKTGLPFQIRALRDTKGWTQAQLGEELGMTQANVSRLESPGYGRLSLTTLQRLASVFDVALIVHFAPFSELIRWTETLSPAVMAPPSFLEESPKLERMAMVGVSESWAATAGSYGTWMSKTADLIHEGFIIWSAYVSANSGRVPASMPLHQEALNTGIGFGHHDQIADQAASTNNYNYLM
jgi:transcriptional regulator with XRE-family HTH domain